jgi:L-threonine kinase
MEAIYRIKIAGSMYIKSDIPIGKGLSSSSADLVAVIKSIYHEFNINYLLKDIDYILKLVEPSDGVAYSSVVAYDYMNCTVLKNYHLTLPLKILSYDEGGIVDTIDFNNNIKIQYSNDIATKYENLFHMLDNALEERNLETVGKISTESTMLNQNRIYKHGLDKILKLNEEIKGLGIINTHSGTCLGILLNQNDHDLESKIRLAKSIYPTIQLIDTIKYENI